MFVRVLFFCLIFKLICGDDIAQRLIDRYNDVTKKCYDKHNNKKPAFQCSGLITRSLAYIGRPQQKYAWSKKPSNVRRNAFSVAFLRRDQPFKSLPFGYESGFIYYPHLKTPSNKYAYRVYCAFPMNGVTDYREGEQGCGEYSDDSSGGSAACDVQGIDTLTKWTTHFKTIIQNYGNSEVEIYQCSFDLTTKNATKNFALALEAKKYLRHASRKYSLAHNEMVIKAWNENHPAKLPIEAFYYALGSLYGRNEAFQYQKDYLSLTNETVPVVGISLPTDTDPNLHVEYDDKL